jgi:Bacterial extracellular solute-binding proteins, family 3
MKVAIAYIEEPPFGWTETDRTATAADIDLAEAVLRAIGATQIEHRLTTFSDLLPGVEAGRWDMNVPLFVTPERAKRVAFSVPVWAIGDGFLVRAGNPKALNSYASFVKRHDARLGIIAGQVQHDSARAAGVSDDQIPSSNIRPMLSKRFGQERSMRMRALPWAIAYWRIVSAVRSWRLWSTSRERMACNKSCRSEHSPSTEETAICSMR